MCVARVGAGGGAALAVAGAGPGGGGGVGQGGEDQADPRRGNRPGVQGGQRQGVPGASRRLPLLQLSQRKHQHYSKQLVVLFYCYEALS